MEETGKVNVGIFVLTRNEKKAYITKTMEIMDKDRFRKDLGGLTEAYTEVLKRMEQGN